MEEADLKLAVSEYLQYGTNQGRWYADRLNSGEVIVIAGQSRRRVKLCREGTSDFFLFRSVNVGGASFLKLMFLELKSEKGRTSPAQNAFKIVIEEQGAEYHIVRSIEDLENILEVNNES